MQLLLALALLASPTVFAVEGEPHRNGERRLKVPLTTKEELNRRLADYGYTRDSITGELVELENEGRRTRNLKKKKKVCTSNGNR